jgi:hypothetical protein
MQPRSLYLTLSILFCQIFCNQLYAQVFTTVKLTKANLPKFIKFKGKIIDAVQYVDSLGENIVLRSETGIYQSKADTDNGTNSADLFAYHYILKEDTALLLWRVTDFIKECELDITANFIEGAFFITDLDKDGTSEVWLVYQTSCRGDVSPNTMKVIMYEGQKKFAMKGERKIKVSPTEVLGGKYIFDAAFLKADAVFRDYAKKLWKKHELNVDEPL